MQRKSEGTTVRELVVLVEGPGGVAGTRGRDCDGVGGDGGMEGSKGDGPEASWECRDLRPALALNELTYLGRLPSQREEWEGEGGGGVEEESGV